MFARFLYKIHPFYTSNNYSKIFTFLITIFFYFLNKVERRTWVRILFFHFTSIKKYIWSNTKILTRNVASWKKTNQFFHYIKISLYKIATIFMWNSVSHPVVADQAIPTLGYRIFFFALKASFGLLGLWLNRLVLKELKIRSKQIVNTFVAQISYIAFMLSGLQLLNAIR